MGHRLVIRSLAKIYPTLSRALDDLDLEIGEGVFGLLGPNGAGKSTLMSILSGELDFESGSVSLDGTDIRRHPVAWRRGLGLMPQHFDFPPHMTGREFMRQSALMSGFSPRGLSARIGELLARVHLEDAAERDAASYSRGMKQRLAAAAAFLCEPVLVLLDEPTSGLDPEERVFFRELLADFSRDRIVMLSTHIVPDVERCCDELAVIQRGALLFQGSPSELVRRAENRVWEMPATQGDHAALAGHGLVGLHRRGDELVARVLAEKKPVPEAVSVSPGLEDAYMDLVGETIAEQSGVTA